MKEIYLDNAATTKVREEVKEEMLRYFEEYSTVENVWFQLRIRLNFV